MKRVQQPAKPTTPPVETKSDATTRAARAIIDSELAARNAKTERLRAARLMVPADVAEPKKARRKRAS